MTRPWLPFLALAAILTAMALLMREPLRAESATVDEPLFLASGYSYWSGYAYRLNPEQPALAQKIFGLPLALQHPTWSPAATELLAGRTGLANTRSWRGEPQPVAELFPTGRADWYYWPYWEGDLVGQMLVYGGDNDADQLLQAGRWTQVGLTLLTGLVIFCWLRRLTDATTALLGTGLWAFQPLALGYGHLILTDVGVTLLLTLAVWAFVEYLQMPGWRRALACGLATGGALVMKFTAVLLGPLFVALFAVRWLTSSRAARPGRAFVNWLPLAALTTWAVVLFAYAPAWRPAPALAPGRAAALGVPGWFQLCRPILIPADFFKGLALQAAHARFGHPAFLNGEWRQYGWWYYYPVAVALKTPLPLLLLGLLGAGGAALRWRRSAFLAVAPLLAGGLFLLGLMGGTIDIGVRYLLPAVPLVIVGVCASLAAQPRASRFVAWTLTGWLLVVTLRARPNYLEYCNEFAHGTRNGFRCLIDSNYDWGQDAKRLRAYVTAQQLAPFYLAYFGPPRIVEYYQLPATRVDAAAAEKLPQGKLVISATLLMQPDWDWLRAHGRPVGRVGYTLFVFDLARRAP